MPKILITGGLGYIGSNVAALAMQEGFDVVVFDNLQNSDEKRLTDISRAVQTSSSIELIVGDVRNFGQLADVFLLHDFYAVVHCAGLKSVPESTACPIEYFDVNVGGTVNLLKCLSRRPALLIFSSSATVYDPSAPMPLSESSALAPQNPYGRSKLQCEEMIRDACRSDKRLRAICLRYFNPVGAGFFDQLPDLPKKRVGNMMPALCSAAKDGHDFVICGDDFDTIDGTGVRDYIHIDDISSAHIAALRKLHLDDNFLCYNIGTGSPISVLQILHCFEKVNGLSVPHCIGKRRAGDPSAVWADPSLAIAELSWRPVKSMDDMCRSSWQSTIDSASGDVNRKPGLS